MADGEYLCAGLFEEPERSLFYRKSLGIRRFLENSPLPEYDKTKRLYPSGKQGAFPYSYTNLLWGQENRIKDKDTAKKIPRGFSSGLCNRHTCRAPCGGAYVGAFDAVL